MSRIASSTPARFRDPRKPDKPYLKSFKDTACEACGTNDGTVVGAHVRAGEDAGMGAKPDDAMVVGLCHGCHMMQEAFPGAEWWFNAVFKNMLRKRHAKWRG